MMLVIDNYDSFTHNLARYFENAGEASQIVRNDEITLEDITTLKPRAIIISPGPCTPQDSGICIDAIKKFGARIPILGICLGHQAIGEAYGATTARAAAPVHGKASTITHNGKSIFRDLPSPMEVGRYHSLIVTPPENVKSYPLKTTAQTEDGEIMAMQHTKHPVYGLQFHPESILTTHGEALVENFTRLVQEWHDKQASPKAKKSKAKPKTNKQKAA
jgi:para-aminobenzoate synthetase component 2